MDQASDIRIDKSIDQLWIRLSFDGGSSFIVSMEDWSETLANPGKFSPTVEPQQQRKRKPKIVEQEVA